MSTTGHPRRRVLGVAVAAALLLAAAPFTSPAHAAPGKGPDRNPDKGPDSGLGYDPVRDKGSLWHVAEAVDAHASYRAGYTGKGIGVALIDTGVTEVPGLDTGNVVHGPDLSFDSQDPELAHKDAYGHGTHLGSIIAGRDVAGTPRSYAATGRFNGVAPDAELVSVKVGASDGAVDVSQVIAAIDWVVAHREELDIRVLNLSYGTNSTQDPRIDPLTFAVERAWKAGIVVVVAAGNDGSTTRRLANPAQSPYVLAVGPADTGGTVGHRDDTVPLWGTRGTNQRHVDLVAPGASVLGARVPNGYADERNPLARVGSRFARASGTSQAAAVMSGAVALLLQARPRLTPDQVKALLQKTAHPFRSTDVKYRGSGLLDVRAAQRAKAPRKVRPPRKMSTGLGSLEAARGTSHVTDGVTELRGEIDIFGRPWNARGWTKAADAAWSGGSWRGFTWSGDGWNARTWRDVVWSSGTWSARTWRDSQWSARTWRDGSWVTDGWVARTWRDALWSARTWRTADLASAGWHARTWG
jgi:serine protease AprX